MIINNFLDLPGVDRVIHNGKSMAKSIKLFGDIILTKPGFSHGLENATSNPLDVFIFWVEK